MAESKHSTVGFIALRFIASSPEILFVLKRKHQIFGFPKGHREAGEVDIQTATRELMEEAGAQPEMYLSSLNSVWTQEPEDAMYLPSFYRVQNKENGKLKRKETKYFIATVRDVSDIHDTTEIEAAQWFPLTAETGEVLRGRPEHNFFTEHVLPLASLQKPDSS